MSFAELDLLRPLTIEGVEYKMLRFERATLPTYEKQIDASGSDDRLLAFMVDCGKAVSEGGVEVTLTDDVVAKLHSADVAECVDILEAQVLGGGDDEERLAKIEGDGVAQSMVVPLSFPITFGAEGSARVIKHFEFSGSDFGSMRSYMQARSNSAEFRSFLRAFARPVEVQVPMSDALMNKIDIEDAAFLRASVMGKLALASGRWRRP